ncbi:MAG TPA: family 78 glycoside hydrolase catalytic domain [Clostridiales bacterium]|nr:family 78 glycoside hydrolase catalytic domain [Clostridiales bacterium]HQH63178.1 family 78 glycoside hydrolase catalytic domain [Clostridiales bacterium]HQK73407.1 family 78 glycoside hydrolase catalytic domain [Clostridiales bacterium]
MTHRDMFGNAAWVVPALECEAPLMVADFESDCTRGEIVVCGLGFFELCLNGRRVGDERFVPVVSDYEKRDLTRFTYPLNDNVSHRIYCVRYDISPYLKGGKNRIGVILGNGWYNQYRRLDEGFVGFGRVKLCFRLTLEAADGSTETVVSDASMKWKPSHIIENNLFYGEIHDYKLEEPFFSEPSCDIGGWENVRTVDPPAGDFLTQDCPTDKVIRFTKPVLVEKREKTSVYDAGENISGYAIVSPPAFAERVIVSYAEELTAANCLDYGSAGGDRQIQKDEFLAAGPGRELSPVFTWHGFRYFEVSNNADALACAVVHADTPRTSAFECDNLNLAWLADAYIRTQLSNMHAGVPSDCPHRERLGYTGDGQLCCEAAMLMLDCRRFYRKWLGDIADCQDPETGHVQHTAPLMGGGGGPGGWGGAVVEVPWRYYRQYGDKDVLKDFFPRMLKYLDYLESRSEDGLVIREEEGGWCLGDWCTPSPMKLPEPFVNTYFYIKYLRAVSEAAGILGARPDGDLLEERAARCCRALTNAYFSPHTHSFIGGVQGADAFGLDIGLGDEHTFLNLARKYAGLGMFDTGIFGTKILIRVLFDMGAPELAASLLAGDKKVSYGRMRAAGATTLWENWNGEGSHSHPMFGAPSVFLFSRLLGIRQKEGSCGWEHAVVLPFLPSFLQRMSGHVTTPRGTVSVDCRREDGRVRATAAVSAGMDAVFAFEGEEVALRPGENVFYINK